MLWTPYDNGGFSTAPLDHYVRPIVAEGDYGFERVSVATQRQNPDSLLNWLVSLIRTRRECPEIGAGRCRVIDTGNDAILALRYDDSEHESTVISPDRQTIALDLTEREITTTTDLLADCRFEPLDPRTQRIRINGFGYRWLCLGGVY
jgi:maltose alpha-D-glucosyltransferase/alpha-amylase